MKKLTLKREEVKKMVLKRKTYALPDFVMKKIEEDIESAKQDRAKGNMGTPIEEVLLNMKKIIEGEMQL